MTLAAARGCEKHLSFRAYVFACARRKQCPGCTEILLRVGFDTIADRAIKKARDDAEALRDSAASEEP